MPSIRTFLAKWFAAAVPRQLLSGVGGGADIIRSADAPRDSPADSGLRVMAIVDESGFKALRETWNVLVGSSHAPSVFLTHEWFSAAWAWRKQNADLLLLCAYCDDVLVGVLPLVTVHAKERGLPLRRIEFLTVPDTQLCDLIAAPGHETAVAAALAAELVRPEHRWDLMRLEFLRRGAVAAGALQAALREHGLPGHCRRVGRNLSIPLASAWSEYYHTRSRSLKKANNLAANRLRKAGSIRIERIEPGVADAAVVARAVDAAIEVSRRSWKQKAGSSLDNAGAQAFIRELSASAHQRGWLSLWTMCVDEKPLAMEYQLVYEGNVHALRADFDATYTHFSPGSHLFRHLLESLCGHGLKRYYMGPGENAYKTRWSDEGDALHTVLIYGKSLRGRLAWLTEAAIKPVFRGIRSRLLALRRAAPVGADAGKAEQQPPARS